MGDSNLPPASRLPTNIDPRTLAILGYTVASWCPGLNGEGKPEAVALVLDIRGLPPLAMRLKSPRAVDEMIAALLRHRADVWPEAPIE